MNKFILTMLFFFCFISILTGCSISNIETESTVNPILKEDIDQWPKNQYTQNLPQPQAGTIDSILWDKNAGYYAIFLNNITKKQGQAYLAQLKEEGFQEIAWKENAAAGGALLQKDAIMISISISNQELAIYIYDTQE